MIRVETDFEIDPERAPGAFLAAVRELRVGPDGLEPGHSVEQIDVTAALAEITKYQCRHHRDLHELLLHRLACATLDVLSTAFTRSDDDRRSVMDWLQARLELEQQRQR